MLGEICLEFQEDVEILKTEMEVLNQIVNNVEIQLNDDKEKQNMLLEQLKEEKIKFEDTLKQTNKIREDLLSRTEKVKTQAENEEKITKNLNEYKERIWEQAETIKNKVTVLTTERSNATNQLGHYKNALAEIETIIEVIGKYKIIDGI